MATSSVTPKIPEALKLLCAEGFLKPKASTMAASHVVPKIYMSLRVSMTRRPP